MIGPFTTKVMAYICAGLGVAVVAMGALLWAAGVRIDDVKNQRDEAKIQLVAAHKSIKEHKDAAKLCSDKTTEHEAESKKKLAAADEALLQAQQEARRYVDANKRRATLLAAPTPSGAGCSHALQELRKELRK